jgi:hypothetical protein
MADDHAAGAEDPFVGPWKAVWVQVSDSMTPGFFPADFKWPVLRTESASELISQIKLRAFPVHLILDRNGAVVEGSVGAAFPQADNLRDDCTLIL